METEFDTAEPKPAIPIDLVLPDRGGDVGFVFADLPADASTIQAFRHGPPDLGQTGNHCPGLACHVLAFDIQPTWAQTRYFVVKLEVFVGPLSN